MKVIFEITWCSNKINSLIIRSFEIVDHKWKLSNFKADRTEIAEVIIELNFADVIL